MIAIKSCLGIVVLASFGAGCSPLVGFKDVTVVDANAGDDARADAPVDAKPDAMIDAGPPPKLWVFVTDASFQGNLGAPSGARRAVADAKCEDKYNASFTARGCTKIHAVIQIDDNLETIPRMEIAFQIPQTSEVLRATDATPVTTNWDTLVDPNGILGASVSSDPSPVPFWSGRDTGNQCSNWTSTAGAGATNPKGDHGNAAVRNAWLSQGNVNCDELEHLLCICW